MAEIEPNIYNGNYKPNKLKPYKTNGEVYEPIPNLKGELVDKDNNISIFLKDELIVKNYAECPSINFSGYRSYGTDGEGRKRDAIDYITINRSKIQIKFIDIWRAVFLSATENKNYLSTSYGYFGIFCNQEYLSNKEDNSSYDPKKGGISDIDFVLPADDSNLSGKFTINTVFEGLYTTIDQENTALTNYGISQRSSTYSRLVKIFKISLDAREWWGSVDELDYGFTIPYFTDHLFENAYLRVYLTKLCSDSSKYISNQMQIPATIQIKNSLIQILSKYTFYGSTSPGMTCSKSQGNNWQWDFQVWCPDNEALDFSYTEISHKFTVSKNEIFNQGNKAYRAVSVQFNIAENVVGDKFWFVLDLTYNKNGVLDSKYVCWSITVLE